MRVLHLSYGDARGGAARAARRLHEALRRLGVDSRMLVARRSTDDPTIGTPSRSLAAVFSEAVYRWRRKSLARRRGRRGSPGAFSDDRGPRGGFAADRLTGDVLHLHWVAHLFDHRAFFRLLPPSLPVVWTLHDQNPFTGGCHYAGSCRRFEERCGACPQLGSARDLDPSRRIWTRKDDAYRALRSRLQLVAPSRWMQREVERSSLLGRARAPVSLVPNGVDVDVFTPRSREAARRALELPQASFVVLFVAHHLDSPLKGLPILRDAVGRLRAEHPGLVLLLCGGAGGSAGLEALPSKRLGWVDDDRKLAEVYSAADVLAVPSLEDNLPNTIIEAMACGTPAVGFAVGGIPDLVRPGRTGLLARSADADGLTDALRSLLAAPERLPEMSRACRATAVEEHALEPWGAATLALYRRLSSRVLLCPADDGRPPSNE